MRQNISELFMTYTYWSKPEVHLPAVAMVPTKVTPILFYGECYMGNWDMKVGAIDPHHRELQANMS